MDQQPGSGAEMAQGQSSPEMMQQIDGGEVAPPNPGVGAKQGIETQQIGDGL